MRPRKRERGSSEPSDNSVPVQRGINADEECKFQSSWLDASKAVPPTKVTDGGLWQPDRLPMTQITFHHHSKNFFRQSLEMIRFRDFSEGDSLGHPRSFTSDASAPLRTATRTSAPRQADFLSEEPVPPPAGCPEASETWTTEPAFAPPVIASWDARQGERET